MAKQKTTDETSIFTAADYKNLRQARRILNDVVHRCDKAQACGIDTSMWRQMRDQIDAELAQIEQLFMTPPPTV